MSGTVLVDTNVLVYSIDGAEAQRQSQAAECLVRLGPRRIRVSTQVLSEFANVITHSRKLARSSSTAIDAVRGVAEFGEVLAVGTSTVLAALQARDRWKLEYYDAQIWASAALNGVTVVLSEDFASGSTLGGVTFVDPFADDFCIDSL